MSAVNVLGGGVNVVGVRMGPGRVREVHVCGIYLFRHVGGECDVEEGVGKWFMVRVE
jgi:hypothetical protein